VSPETFFFVDLNIENLIISIKKLSVKI
jgi:hypothetical protein